MFFSPGLLGRGVGGFFSPPRPAGGRGRIFFAASAGPGRGRFFFAGSAGWRAWQDFFSQPAASAEPGSGRPAAALSGSKCFVFQWVSSFSDHEINLKFIEIMNYTRKRKVFPGFALWNSSESNQELNSITFLEMQKIKMQGFIRVGGISEQAPPVVEVLIDGKMTKNDGMEENIRR